MAISWSIRNAGQAPPPMGQSLTWPILAIVVASFLFSGFFIVQPNQAAVLQLFGKFVGVERTAAMVSNLLVVLCGERGAQPTVNTGALYS